MERHSEDDPSGPQGDTIQVDGRFLLLVDRILSASHTTTAAQLSTVVEEHGARIGLRLEMFVVDYEQRTLYSLPTREKPSSTAQPVDTSLAGEVFQHLKVKVDDRPGRLWLPILDGTVRLGVLKVDLPADLDAHDRSVRHGCTTVASLLGHLIQVKTPLGDDIETVRRTRPMTPASELLWKLVSPPTFTCEDMSIAAVAEPCYAAGGDGYDYSVGEDAATVVLLDAVGHGLPASVTCSVALSTLRAARRQGRPLVEAAAAVDEAIQSQWSDSRFATAVLAEIDLRSGAVAYVNAGHPPPALIRDGRVIGTLDEGRRLPLGLSDTSPEPGRAHLRPGDRLLFYTDGVTEARAEDDTMFGLDRLVRLVEEHSASRLPTAEVLRRIDHALLAHQKGHLQDDATLLLLERRPIVAEDIP